MAERGRKGSSGPARKGMIKENQGIMIWRRIIMQYGVAESREYMSHGMKQRRRCTAIREQASRVRPHMRRQRV